MSNKGEREEFSRRFGLSAQQGGPQTPIAMQEMTDPTDMVRALLAARASIDRNIGLADEDLWKQTVQLARWQCDPQKARNWRITFGPVVRRDGSQVPRVDVNTQPPIGIQLVSSNPFTFQPVGWPWYVRIKFGAGPSAPQECIAHYPALGGSVDVVASYIQVEVFFDYSSDFSSILGQDPRADPVFSCYLAPSNVGVDYSDAAGLSYVQRYGVADFTTLSYFQVPPFARWVAPWWSDAVPVQPQGWAARWFSNNGRTLGNTPFPPSQMSTGFGDAPIPETPVSNAMQIGWRLPVPSGAGVLGIAFDPGTSPPTTAVDLSLLWSIRP